MYVLYYTMYMVYKIINMILFTNRSINYIIIIIIIIVDLLKTSQYVGCN